VCWSAAFSLVQPAETRRLELRETLGECERTRYGFECGCYPPPSLSLSLSLLWLHTRQSTQDFVGHNMHPNTVMQSVQRFAVTAAMLVITFGTEGGEASGYISMSSRMCCDSESDQSDSCDTDLFGWVECSATSDAIGQPGTYADRVSRRESCVRG
jgi:hypothetical protein